MQVKSSRQNKIVELVQKNSIETQEELADLLTQAGYTVTQATISRDIRELKLTKVPTEDGRQKYSVLQNQPSGLNEKFVRVFRDAFLSMEQAQNILVIKTVSGMAMAAAAALDALPVDGIVGSIAGDDTIMCAIRTEQETPKVMEALAKLVYGR